MTARDHAGEPLAAGALDRVLALRGDVAVPDDLARRIVVRTAVLPQHGAGVVNAVDSVVPLRASGRVSVPDTALPHRQRAWAPLGAALAASVALLLALPTLGSQMFSRTPGQGPARPLPQVAAAAAPVVPAAAPVPLGGGHAVARRQELAVADAPRAAAPAVIPDAPLHLASADDTAPIVPIQPQQAPTAQPQAWRAAQPVRFALAADVARLQVYGPVLDPAASHGSASARMGGTVGLGFAEGGGR